MDDTAHVLLDTDVLLSMLVLLDPIVSVDLRDDRTAHRTLTIHHYSILVIQHEGKAKGHCITALLSAEKGDHYQSKLFTCWSVIKAVRF